MHHGQDEEHMCPVGNVYPYYKVLRTCLIVLVYHLGGPDYLGEDKACKGCNYVWSVARVIAKPDNGCRFCVVFAKICAVFKRLVDL